MYYVICGIVCFCIGWICSYLFQKYVSIEFKVKKAEIKHKVFTDTRLQKIQIMLEEIKRCGTIPIKIPKAAEKSLMLIAQTKDWDKQIDEETIKTLNKIYNSWQLHIESEKHCELGRGTKTGEMQGFKRKEYEITQAEYEQALKEGKIEPQSIVTIIPENDNDYKGSWLEMNLNTGEMEEYME